jgi:hypothetical protein
MRIVFLFGIVPFAEGSLVSQHFIGQLSERYFPAHAQYIVNGNVKIQRTERSDEIKITGTDDTSLPWTIYALNDSGTDYSLAWSADLNEDKREDLLIYVHKGRIGRCLDESRLLLIVFDPIGRPVPLEVNGYFSMAFDLKVDQAMGIREVGDWNVDGNVELVHVDCYSHDQKYQDSENETYGVAAVYELNGSRWKSLSTSEVAKNIRAYHRAARREARVLVTSPSRSNAFIQSVSNDINQGTTTRIVKYVEVPAPGCGPAAFVRVDGDRVSIAVKDEREKIRRRCESHLVIADGRACFGHPAVVDYGTSQTIAIMNGTSNRVRPIMDRAIAESRSVTLFGSLEEDTCAPSLIEISE